MNINTHTGLDNVLPIEITGGNVDPLLWCRNGEYRIVPTGVIKNAINLMSMYAMSNGKRTQPAPVIMWSQGIPISNQAGRALIGE